VSPGEWALVAWMVYVAGFFIFVGVSTIFR